MSCFRRGALFCRQRHGENKGCNGVPLGYFAAKLAAGFQGAQGKVPVIYLTAKATALQCERCNVAAIVGKYEYFEIHIAKVLIIFYFCGYD